MRWRVFLGLSLIANLILAISWFRGTPPTNALPDATRAATNTLTSTNGRPAVIVRRQFFSWQELESRDYPTYIKNLREIGCPEQTIRDLIIADVTQMLRDKYQEQSPRLNPNPKWWTNYRDPTATRGSSPQTTGANDLWAERNAILKQLLGPDWAVRGSLQPAQPNLRQAYVLATMELNPTLQGLAAEKKQAVAALLAETDAAPIEPVKTLADDQARWTKVAELLPLNQLEAAKLYFSVHAENLRGELDSLVGFNTQPEEFRKIFHATETIDLQLAALGDRDDLEAQQQREKLFTDRDDAVRAALTRERFEQYVRLQDPAYLSAIDLLPEGGNPATLPLLYAINREAAAELERIQSDETLTERQREIAVKQLEVEQLKATALALGEPLRDEPAPKEVAPKPEPARTHTVAGGEGLERIARLYAVDPSALRAANPNVNFDKLQPGATVSVPLRLIYPMPPPE